MKKILNKVDKYYSEKVSLFGATSKGVDWNGEESQYLRFAQLSLLFLGEKNPTILDYGCGYGAFTAYVNSNDISYKNYLGFDISEKMIKEATNLYESKKNKFTTKVADLSMQDYVIASGIFNVKLDIHENNWYKYICNTLEEIDKLSRKGFSFNLLTSYSDKEFMRDYLYYADPLKLFHFCKVNFSKRVTLLHDYPLYEFTIIVRK